MKTICLVMIVRNEENVIERCLSRVKNYIDYWVIVDTGSTDETITKIKNTLINIPGELYQSQWQNFGYNRTESLAFAKGKADYLLLCDADEEIIFSEFFDKSTLTADAYLLSYMGDTDYAVPNLIRGDRDWHFVGVTHEYLDSSHVFHRQKLGTLSILDHKDGGFKQDKFTRDIQLLEQGLIDEPTNSRYKFYLANSYRDISQNAMAIKWYTERIKDGGWLEEVTCSYENMGLCHERMGQTDQALLTWLEGYNANPDRIECLYHVVRSYRLQNKMALAYQLGKIAAEIPYPKNDVLFVRRNLYNYEIYFELSIASFYTNDFKTGYLACKVLLFSDYKTHFDISLYNLYFYRYEMVKDKLSTQQSLLNILKCEYEKQGHQNQRLSEMINIIESSILSKEN